MISRFYNTSFEQILSIKLASNHKGELVDWKCAYAPPLTLGISIQNFSSLRIILCEEDMWFSHFRSKLKNLSRRLKNKFEGWRKSDLTKVSSVIFVLKLLFASVSSKRTGGLILERNHFSVTFATGHLHGNMILLHIKELIQVKSLLNVIFVERNFQIQVL